MSKRLWTGLLVGLLGAMALVAVGVGAFHAGQRHEVTTVAPVIGEAGEAVRVVGATGNNLKGVTARRDAKWVSRMILRPDVMVKDDATAKQMLATHMVPMPNQGVDPTKELPYLVAYLKANE